MPTAVAQKQYNCFASSRISPERVLHLTVREHYVKNIDLSDEYAECPTQCDSPLPPKLSAYSKIPLVLVISYISAADVLVEVLLLLNFIIQLLMHLSLMVKRQTLLSSWSFAATQHVYRVCAFQSLLGGRQPCPESTMAVLVCGCICAKKSSGAAASVIMGTVA